jgi:hypothetical protein
MKILLVLALVVVLGLILFVPHGGYRRAVEAYKKQLIVKGEKLAIEQLALPPPDNVSNGGPALLLLMRDLKPSTNFPTMMPEVAPGFARVAGTNLSHGEMVGYEQNLSNMANLRVVIAAPVLYLHVTYDPDAGYGSPVLEKLRDTERLLVTTSAQAFYASNFSESRADLLAALDLVRLYSAGPHMAPFWLRALLARDAFNPTWEALQSDAWSEPQLAELQNRWQCMELFSDAAAGLAFNRADIIAYLAKLRETASNNAPIWGNQAFFVPSVPPSNNQFLDGIMHSLAMVRTRVRFRQWKSSWSYEEELYYLRSIEAAQESMQAALDSGAYAPASQAFDQQASNIDRFFPDRTNHFLLYVQGHSQRLGGPLATPALAEMGRRICVTAIALKRYHLQHGVYPATLNDLVPAFLPAVPMDFMDGKPLRYKLRSDGDFLLYSVGLDGVDNGGDPRPDTGFLLDWPWSIGHTAATSSGHAWPRPLPSRNIVKNLGPSRTRLKEVFSS